MGDLTAPGAFATDDGSVPAEVARLETDLLAAEAEVSREKAALGELQKERRRLETSCSPLTAAAVKSALDSARRSIGDVSGRDEWRRM